MSASGLRDRAGDVSRRNSASLAREATKNPTLDVRAKDDLELYYKTIPDYFEQDDGRKLTEIPDRTSTDMIEGRY